MSLNAWNPVCIHYNLCLKGMHKFLIHYRSGLLALCQGKLNTWQNFNEYLMIVMCYECTPLCNMDGEHKERIQQTRGGTT